MDRTRWPLEAFLSRIKPLNAQPICLLPFRVEPVTVSSDLLLEISTQWHQNLLQHRSPTWGMNKLSLLYSPSQDYLTPGRTIIYRRTNSSRWSPRILYIWYWPANCSKDLTAGFIDTAELSGQTPFYTPVIDTSGFWKINSQSASVNGTKIDRSGNTAIADTGTS